MKKFLGWVLAGLVLAGGSFALTSANINDADVAYEQGYFVGVFYKEVETGKVYKVVNASADAVYIAEFEDGELAGGK